MKYLALIISVSVLFACQNEKTDLNKKNEVTIAGKIKNFSKGEFVIYNWNQRVVLNLNNQGDFNISLDVEDFEYLNFKGRRFNMQFSCEPGDSLYFTYDIEEKNKIKSVQFSGDKSLENNYLVKKLSIENNFNGFPERQLEFQKVIIASDEAFILELEKFKESLDDELFQLEKMGVHADFVNYEKFSNQAEVVKKISSSLAKKRQFFIPQFKKLFDPKGNISLSEVDTIRSPRLTKIVKDLDLNNSELYNINKRQYIQYANSVINFFPTDYSIEILKDDFAIMDINYYIKMNKKAEKYLKDSSVLEGYYYELINSLVSWGKTGIANEYLKHINNENWRNFFEERIYKKIEERKGLVVDFPDFQAVRPTDELFSKNQLIGKYTYIDFWATWCGPCKREIPRLKELEKEYHGKNINFVSISIDSEKDKEKWKKMVKDLDLTGIQLHISKENYEPIKELLKINAIPRFVLLDSDGKTIVRDAPRPSSLDIRPLLNSLLEE